MWAGRAYLWASSGKGVGVRERDRGQRSKALDVEEGASVNSTGVLEAVHAVQAPASYPPYLPCLGLPRDACCPVHDLAPAQAEGECQANSLLVTHREGEWMLARSQEAWTLSGAP